MTVTLCVLLWANEGAVDALVEYEDAVLRLLPDHGGRVLHRARTRGAPGEPTEIHLLELPSEASLDAYMRDDRRTALAGARERAIARTELYRVDLV